MLHRFKIASHGLQPVALAKQQRHQCQHGKPREEKDLVHQRIKPRTRPAHNHRLRVLRPPPADGTKNERHVQESEYAEQRAEQGASVRLFDERP